MALSTAMKPLPAYARVLRSLAVRRGLNQTKLSALAGVARPLINRHLTGRTEPNYETLNRYALAFGLDPERLVERIEAAKNSSAGVKGRPRLVLYLGDQIVGESSDPNLFADVIERVERVRT